MYWIQLVPIVRLDVVRVGIDGRSSQSSGLDAAGSLIVFGGRNPNSSSMSFVDTSTLSILTTYELFGYMIRVYTCVSWSVSL